MLLKKLTLTNVRAFSHAEITFQPGMNLIVGINGVGKSTILESIRMVLAAALPKFSRSSSTRKVKFVPNDIKKSANQLEARLRLQVANIPINCELQYADNKQSLKLEPYNPNILNLLKNDADQPLAVYFSPRRALSSINKPIDTTSGIALAFLDALDHRELRLMEFADFLLVYNTLIAENPPESRLHQTAQQSIDTLNAAITGFIDCCSDIRAFRLITADYRKSTPKTETTLLINKAGVSLDIRQLSDGERGMLALVLDLARRLTIANPTLEDPLQGKAVVLIDELDLHLHPKWQRTIVQKLTTTFPNCQFIATTHSPQIIGEVSPESIILLEEGQPPMRPDQSIGMDTDWILKYLMDAPTRNQKTEQELNRIAELIETEDYDEATDAIDHLRETIGEFPELVRLQTRIDRLQLLGE